MILIKIRNLGISLVFTLLPLLGFSQSDTIITNAERIPCTVKEVTADAIKFSYPQEDLINTIYKNAIKKVVFKSGRVQTFAESIPLKTLRTSYDFESVSITNLESDTKGLNRIGDMTVNFSGLLKANQFRILRKIKLLGAMMGANLILMTNINSEGKVLGSSEGNLTGIAYTNKKKYNIDDFKKNLNGKPICLATKHLIMDIRDNDIVTKNISTKFYVNDVYEEAGNIKIKGSLGAVYGLTTYNLVFMDNNTFDLYFEDKSSFNNISIAFIKD
jgi:hypothetical protein